LSGLALNFNIYFGVRSDTRNEITVDYRGVLTGGHLYSQLYNQLCVTQNQWHAINLVVSSCVATVCNATDNQHVF